MQTLPKIRLDVIGICRDDGASWDDVVQEALETQKPIEYDTKEVKLSTEHGLVLGTWGPDDCDLWLDVEVKGLDPARYVSILQLTPDFMHELLTVAYRAGAQHQSMLSRQALRDIIPE